jgi:hypothetical protein
MIDNCEPNIDRPTLAVLSGMHFTELPELGALHKVTYSGGLCVLLCLGLYIPSAIFTEHRSAENMIKVAHQAIVPSFSLW